MKIAGTDWRTIWVEPTGESVGVIDQTLLPHRLEICLLRSCKDVVNAISSMVVRGAPLIGITGAFGLMLALKDDPGDVSMYKAFDQLICTRPTAVNLRWALERIVAKVKSLDRSERFLAALNEASLMVQEDISMCNSIGEHGLKIIREIALSRPPERQEEPLNILTHCNAGWLATVDWGTALAPIYKASREEINIHVWVSETRPRNQGSGLTAFELAGEDVPHTVIVDNACGYLMQEGKIDLVIVGSDRTTCSGDVCNKIGTYMKALAAFDNDLPFYVALPSSTIDWSIGDGLKNIPIEVRSSDEVTHVNGLLDEPLGATRLVDVQLTLDKTPGYNPAFDVTPAKYVTGLITERGLIQANEKALKMFFRTSK